DLFGQTRRSRRTNTGLCPGKLVGHRIRRRLKTGDTSMATNTAIRRVAIVGTGVIGASWAALFLAKGLNVTATDVDPDAEKNLKSFIEAAWPPLETLGLAPGASQSKLAFT